MIPAKYAQRMTPGRLRDIEAALWWEHDRQERNRAEVEAAAIIKANRVRVLRPDMRDVEIRQAAEGRAEAMRDHINDVTTRPYWWAWVGECVQELNGRPIDIERMGVDERAGVLLRYKCRDWWTRQLRRVVVAMREQEARELSQVSARRRQPYLTDDTVRRLLERDAASRAMLERSEIESAQGDVITLADAADASTSNPAIRRGELMTRITGCERWADPRGWLGLFTTHTTPSRFHATRHTGESNPAWTAAGCPTVRLGQGWLCKTWAKCRAAMARRGLEVFGVRVAEPHQDGTPHWHMMLWVAPSRAEVEGVDGCKPGQAEKAAALMRAYWLADSGDERGASEHRFKSVGMEPGGAAGYCAKYISKGIDDAGDVGASGHVDDTPDGKRVRMEQSDLFGGGATRVRMWARAHSIRQFQPIGQPPVTVWRELRRVPEAEAKQGPGVVVQMWDAVNREGERRACWATYMERQGGACIGRDYRVKVATEGREQVGRYETTTKARPVGVLDTRDKLAQVVRSSRKEWRPKGDWNVDSGRGLRGDGVRDVVRGGAAPLVGAAELKQGAKPRAAWTRANNCTGPSGRNEDLRRRFAWAFADEVPKGGADGPSGPAD